MRKNRFDPNDAEHLKVAAEPEKYTRASRRATGQRRHIDRPPMGSPVPRYLRRHASAWNAALHTRRARKARARILRIVRRYQ